MCNPRPAVPTYYAGMVCHECGGRNFWIKSSSAECGRCEAIYVIAQPKEHVTLSAVKEPDNG